MVVSRWGRIPEFESLPNWWWVVYHFFPVWYLPAWTWRLWDLEVHSRCEQKELQERFYVVWRARKISPKGQKGWEKFQFCCAFFFFFFFFSPFCSVPTPRQYYSGGSSGPVMMWQQGGNLKLKEENPFSLWQWSFDPQNLEQIPLLLLLYILLLSLDTDAGSV